MKNWISRRFKTERDREFHREMSIESSSSYDKCRIKYIKEVYNLSAEQLSLGVIRVTDGVKSLDLYDTRYFKVDTKERGFIYEVGEDELIKSYFDLTQTEKLK